MEVARIMLDIYGKRTTTVPKYDITPAEVLVLQRQFGEDAVFDIQVTGEKDRTKRAEKVRLLELYAGKNGKPSPVTDLFPSITAADMPEQFAELDLDDSFYKAVARVKPPALKKRGKGAPAAEDDGVDAAFE